MNFEKAPPIWRGFFVASKQGALDHPIGPNGGDDHRGGDCDEGAIPIALAKPEANRKGGQTDYRKLTKFDPNIETDQCHAKAVWPQL